MFLIYMILVIGIAASLTYLVCMMRGGSRKNRSKKQDD